MKKFVLWLLAFASCFVFAACSDDKKPSFPDNSDGSQTEEPNTGEDPTPESGQETELPRLDF